MYSYEPSGVCSRKITFDVIDNKVSHVEFIGGCNGNLQGLSNLVEGMDVKEAIKKLQGIKCGGKETSCPDQFSKALIKALESKIK